MKNCKKCNTEKSLDQFHRDRGSRDGRTSYCKSCQIKKSRKYYRDNRETISQKDRARWTPERSRQSKDKILQRKYGLTLPQYEEILSGQGGVCAICSGPEPMQDGRAMPVDHDHKTGKVRGILCSSCNRALGLLKDDPKIILRAVEYLTREEDIVQTL